MSAVLTVNPTSLERLPSAHTTGRSASREISVCSAYRLTRSAPCDDYTLARTVDALARAGA